MRKFLVIAHCYRDNSESNAMSEKFYIEIEGTSKIDCHNRAKEYVEKEFSGYAKYYYHMIPYETIIRMLL